MEHCIQPINLFIDDKARITLECAYLAIDIISGDLPKLNNSLKKIVEEQNRLNVEKLKIMC